jgi:hypothetical protein
MQDENTKYRGKRSAKGKKQITVKRWARRTLATIHIIATRFLMGNFSFPGCMCFWLLTTDIPACSLWSSEQC